MVIREISAKIAPACPDPGGDPTEGPGVEPRLAAVLAADNRGSEPNWLGRQDLEGKIRPQAWTNPRIGSSGSLSSEPIDSTLKLDMKGFLMSDDFELKYVGIVALIIGVTVFVLGLGGLLLIII